MRHVAEPDIPTRPAVSPTQELSESKRAAFRAILHVVGGLLALLVCAFLSLLFAIGVDGGPVIGLLAFNGCVLAAIWLTLLARRR